MRQTIGISVSAIFALFSIAILGNAEIEKVEEARQKAESAIEEMSGPNGYYYGATATIQNAFSNTLWGGNQAAKKYGKIAANRVNLDYFYRIEGGGVARAGRGMIGIAPEKIHPATKEGVMAHFQDTAMVFLENKPHDSQQPYGMLLAVFLLKLLGGLAPSMIPFLLSVFAEPLWFAGLAATTILVAVAFVRPANGQVNLLKTNVSVQGAERSVTPALFRFYDNANAYASVTSSVASIGGGPSWSVSDTLEWAGRKFKLAIHNPVGLDHDGSQIVSMKLWNVMTGEIGRFSLYSKSFLSFPAFQSNPNLALSANHVMYGVTDKLQIGWRTKNVLVKMPTKWINNWRMGPVGKIKLSDNVSGLFHFAQIGSSPGVRLEMSVMF